MFCIGDRVVVIRQTDGNSDLVGWSGRVELIDTNGRRSANGQYILTVCVVFDESFVVPWDGRREQMWWCESSALVDEKTYQFNKLLDEYYEM